MSSRKFAVDKASARNFPEKQNFKPRSNEKRLTHSKDGFFIKKSKSKNVPSDDAVDRKNIPTGARNFPEKQNFKPRSNEKQLSNLNDGFFIKQSKNRNVPSGDAVNKNNISSSAQKKLSRKKETYLQNPIRNRTEQETIKKPFDKKSWRFKKYNKKFKLEQWKEGRKTRLLREYDKTMKETKPIAINFEEENGDHGENSTREMEQANDISSNSDTSNNREESNFVQIPTFPKKKKHNKPYQGDNEDEDKKIEYLKRKAAKEEALKEYKKKKLEKYRKLNRKTRKGQPVMKGRIEVLLEEIEKSIGK